jgi:hypothetical protein
MSIVRKGRGIESPLPMLAQEENKAKGCTQVEFINRPRDAIEQPFIYFYIDYRGRH